MKSDDKKKMYDISGIKDVYFEEMYERTDSDKADSEKKEIREIREIFSDKSKFLGSVFYVKFAYSKIVSDSGYVNYIDGFANYEADNDSELDNFYFVYKVRGYDSFEIDSIEKDDSMWGKCTYSVEMHKKYDGYTLYATMILDVRT
ncbi:MAG: hypothetical protein KHZ66_08700 [Lacticaseibacillus rhamnosus]|nr:hypothetical protein [Lacticaseibacillus rhamnosus]